jgi:hypothetical protein
VLGLDVFISGGDEVASYRNIGLNVIQHLQQMFQKDLNIPVAIGTWDFRLDPPGVVAAGTLSARSLSMVERTNCIVVVFGGDLPKLTCKEVRHAFKLRERGNDVEVKVFLSRLHRTRSHSDFLRRLKQRFHEEVVYAQYDSRIDFQAKLFTTLMPFVMKKMAAAGITVTAA